MADEKPKPGRLTVVIGPKPGGDESEDGASPKDLACKALWKSIKDGDDYGAFRQALDDFLEYRQDAGSATDE